MFVAVMRRIEPGVQRRCPEFLPALFLHFLVAAVPGLHAFDRLPGFGGLVARFEMIADEEKDVRMLRCALQAAIEALRSISRIGGQPEIDSSFQHAGALFFSMSWISRI